MSDTQYARLSVAAAQTDVELVAAPGENRAIQILAIFITAEGTTEVELYADDGTTLLHQVWIISNQRGHPLAAGSQPWDQLPENENLTITSDGAVNMFVKVVYRLINV